HHARLQPALSKELSHRQQGVAPGVVEISWRCQQRLHHKYRHLPMAQRGSTDLANLVTICWAGCDRLPLGRPVHGLR
ncbi:MAG: hypothetical protein ABSC16_13280, partial [Candidatus Dormibacteria bacterium]